MNENRLIKLANSWVKEREDWGYALSVYALINYLERVCNSQQTDNKEKTMALSDHKNALIVDCHKRLADGKPHRIEHQHGGTFWARLESRPDGMPLTDWDHADCDYRIEPAPLFKNINGHNVYMHLVDEPAIGDLIYIADPAMPSLNRCENWYENPLMKWNFERGNCYAMPGYAKAAAAAMLEYGPAIDTKA